MTNTLLNVRSLPIKAPTLRRFVLASLCLGILGTFSTGAIAQTPNPPASTEYQSAPASTPTSNDVAQKLVGQWQLYDSGVGQPVTFIFTPEGKLFLLVEPPNAPPQALAMAYRIDSTTAPMQIDLVGSSETAATIFELTPDGQLRLELGGLSPDTPRPTEFTADAPLLQRSADVTELPPDTEITNF